MHQILISIGIICYSTSIYGQSLIGAWEAINTNENGEQQRYVVIFAEAYQVMTTYHASTGEFIHTNGGSYALEGNTITELVEFHTDDTTKIGKSVSFDIDLTDHTLSKVDDNLVFHRIDNGAPGDLQGAWLMSGRIKNGVSQYRDTNKPRKTMKILSGTRFQWIAYNTETKEFKGTGGGTYTTIDGKYAENIEFFSRDHSKVGLSLEFDYDLIDGHWHHSGSSSKGQPIHEIWSSRK